MSECGLIRCAVSCAPGRSQRHRIALAQSRQAGIGSHFDAVFQVEQAKPTHVTSSGMASALLSEYNAKRRRKEQIKATSTVSRRPLNEPVSTRNGPLSHGEGAPRLG
jgi:hypothetical protein